MPSDEVAIWELTKAPTIPNWFAQRLVWLYELYPNATTNRGTVISWWEMLHDLPARAVWEAMDRAARVSTQYCPSAPMVREHAVALAKTGIAKLRGDLSRPALPAHEEPLDPRYQAIVDRVRESGLTGKDALKALIRGVVETLDGKREESPPVGDVDQQQHSHKQEANADEADSLQPAQASNHAER